MNKQSLTGSSARDYLVPLNDDTREKSGEAHAAQQ